MKILYYDCFAGISGDMNLAALVDLGVDSGYLAGELDKLCLKGYELRVSRGERRGIAGTKVDVILAGGNGHHDHHEHRNLDDIELLIKKSTLPDRVKKTGLAIFGKLAEAEAAVHGTDVRSVHFHEVGAVDAIVDIVGAAVCLDALGIDEVISSPVELGGGFVTCAHGILPVPAPATTEILKGVPVKTGAAPFEMTTPTGAAILVSIAKDFRETVDFTLLKAGYGVGNRDTEIPNLLRVMLGETDGTAPGRRKIGETVLVECNIDDMSPEFYEYIMDTLFDAGALDVYLTPVIMKKSRPAVVLSVICSADMLAAVEEIILAETTTIGLRKVVLQRTTLKRDISRHETPFGEVRVKHTYLGKDRVKSKPEYEDCRRIAREKGIPLHEIYEALEKALSPRKENL